MAAEEQFLAYLRSQRDVIDGVFTYSGGDKGLNKRSCKQLQSFLKDQGIESTSDENEGKFTITVVNSDINGRNGKHLLNLKNFAYTIPLTQVQLLEHLPKIHTAINLDEDLIYDGDDNKGLDYLDCQQLCRFLQRQNIRPQIAFLNDDPNSNKFKIIVPKTDVAALQKFADPKHPFKANFKARFFDFSLRRIRNWAVRLFILPIQAAPKVNKVNLPIRVPKDKSIKHRRLTVNDENGTVLSGYSLKGKNAVENHVSFFFPGNAEQVGDFLNSEQGINKLQALADNNQSKLLLFDRPGTGLSTGIVLEGEQLKHYAWACLRAAIRNGATAITIYARSIGGFSTIEVIEQLQKEYPKVTFRTEALNTGSEFYKTAASLGVSALTQGIGKGGKSEEAREANTFIKFQNYETVHIEPIESNIRNINRSIEKKKGEISELTNDLLTYNKKFAAIDQFKHDNNQGIFNIGGKQLTIDWQAVKKFLVIDSTDIKYKDSLWLQNNFFELVELINYCEKNDIKINEKYYGDLEKIFSSIPENKNSDSKEWAGLIKRCKLNMLADVADQFSFAESSTNDIKSDNEVNTKETLSVAKDLPALKDLLDFFASEKIDSMDNKEQRSLFVLDFMNTLSKACRNGCLDKNKLQIINLFFTKIDTFIKLYKQQLQFPIFIAFINKIGQLDFSEENSLFEKKIKMIQNGYIIKESDTQWSSSYINFTGMIGDAEKIIRQPQLNKEEDVKYLADHDMKEILKRNDEIGVLVKEKTKLEQSLKTAKSDPAYQKLVLNQENAANYSYKYLNLAQKFLVSVVATIVRPALWLMGWSINSAQAMKKMKKGSYHAISFDNDEVIGSTYGGLAFALQGQTNIEISKIEKTLEKLNKDLTSKESEIKQLKGTLTEAIKKEIKANMTDQVKDFTALSESSKIYLEKIVKSQSFLQLYGQFMPVNDNNKEDVIKTLLENYQKKGSLSNKLLVSYLENNTLKDIKIGENEKYEDIQKDVSNLKEQLDNKKIAPEHVELLHKVHAKNLRLIELKTQTFEAAGCGENSTHNIDHSGISKDVQVQVGSEKTTLTVTAEQAKNLFTNYKSVKRQQSYETNRDIKEQHFGDSKPTTEKINKRWFFYDKENRKQVLVDQKDEYDKSKKARRQLASEQFLDIKEKTSPEFKK